MTNALAPGASISNYVVVRTLGSGGQADVYEVAAPDQQRYALKLLSSDVRGNSQLVARLVHEAEIASKIAHPNVLRIFGVEKVGAHVFLRMELLEGCTLDALIRKGPLPIDRACDLILDVARGLLEMHRCGLVHRDVKPANIFVCASETRELAKVMDFGIAKSRPGGDLTSLTGTGLIVGTPAYMSPEQALTPDAIDHRSDIYSLGLILFEALTGRRPFMAKEPLQLIVHHARSKPPSPREMRPAISPELAGVVLCCLAKAPGERFESIASFISRLEATRSSRIVRPKPASIRPTRWLPALALVPLALVCAAAWFERSPEIVESVAAEVRLKPPETPAPTPLGPEDLAEMATAALTHGDLAGSKELLVRCLLLAPNFAACHRQMGVTYAHIDDLEGSMHHYRRYLELEPNAPDAPKIRKLLASVSAVPEIDPVSLHRKLDFSLVTALSARGLSRADLVLVSPDLGADWLAWDSGPTPDADGVVATYTKLQEEAESHAIDRTILETKLDRAASALRDVNRTADADGFRTRYAYLKDRIRESSDEDSETLARAITNLEESAKNARR